MELNVQPVKGQECLKKNKLYQVCAKAPVITWQEEHQDSEPEIADLDFQIPNEGKAVVSFEYRNKDYHKSKAADILCIVIDDMHKQVQTCIFDGKRTMTGFDETKPVDELRRDAVKRIKEFILQIQDSMIHKEGLTAPYVKYYGYEEQVCAGIITREFDSAKLKRLEDKLKGTLLGSSGDFGIAGIKYGIASAGIRKDIEMVSNFRKKKIAVLNRNLDLQVHILEHSAEKRGYYVKIAIGSKCPRMAASASLY